MKYETEKCHGFHGLYGQEKSLSVFIRVHLWLISLHFVPFCLCAFVTIFSVFLPVT